MPAFPGRPAAAWRFARALVMAGALAAGVARADPAPQDIAASALAITADERATRIVLELSAPVAIDVYGLGAPPRIVVDLPMVDWRMHPAPGAGLAARVRFGLAAPGRSRLVVDLTGPARVMRAEASPTTSGAELTLELAAAQPLDELGIPILHDLDGAREAAAAGEATGLTVALDPGHGGVDPGAVDGGMVEKDVTLAFSRTLAERLELAGHSVVLTREGDEFMGLEARVSRARAAGADVLLSLHADAAPQAHVAGASVYTLSPQASEALSAALAARENAGALALAAMFPGLESDVARVLAPAIRRRTAAASALLGAALVDGLAAQTPVLPGRPLRAAGFQVLRAPDVASALIELGFLSNADDRARLADPAWLADTAAAVASSIEAWSDAAAPHTVSE